MKNKETYKDAVEILQRFGGNDRSITSFATPARSPPAANTTLERKMVNTSTNMTPAAFKTPTTLRQMANPNVSTLQQKLGNQPTPVRSLNVSSMMSARGGGRTPYPLIDSSQKTVVDKMVDYLIGDGPSNRFAMICQQCFKHNGKQFAL